MKNNIIITVGIVFILIIGIFFVFSSGSCKKEYRNVNQYSLTHMTLTTPPEETPDWVELEKVFRARLNRYADMRIFQISKDGREAIVEITGARDPNITASLLITPMKIFIKPSEGEEQIAAAEEIIDVQSIYFEDESLGLYIKLSEDANTRLISSTADATPDNPVSFDMFIDGKKFSTSEYPVPIQDGSLQFEMPKDFDEYMTDIIAFMLSKQLPFPVGVVVERSWFIPPQGETEAPIEFTDVVGEMVE